MNLYDLYPHWKTRTERVRESLNNLTKEQLEFRHREDMRSLGNLYRHIIAAEIYWFHDVVGNSGNKYKEIEDDELPDAESILNKWEEVRAKSQELVATFSMADLSNKFKNFKNREYELSYIIWHVAEHEIHHSGQISQMLRVLRLNSPIF
ncbi:MAG: DinB family protein [Leptospiraceae bacterium]|nr:DinB family protein [Leptospiraceae bacterium]